MARLDSSRATRFGRVGLDIVDVSNVGRLDGPVGDGLPDRVVSNVGWPGLDGDGLDTRRPYGRGPLLIGSGSGGWQARRVGAVGAAQRVAKPPAGPVGHSATRRSLRLAGAAVAGASNIRVAVSNRGDPDGGPGVSNGCGSDAAVGPSNRRLSNR